MASTVRFVLLTLAIVVGIVALWALPELLVPDEGLSAEERARLKFEERRTAIGLLVALGGAAGLVYTHRRHELDRDANRTDRYASAVGQLGHESVDVQLGGIYALERIAQDSARDRTAIVQVLGTFVRTHAASGDESESMRELPVTVEAALEVLTARPLDGSYPIPNLARTDLSTTNLRELDLQGMNLAEIRLTGAALEGVRFSDADLTRADLSDATGSDLDFSGADLTGANLASASLPRGDFRGTVLAGASMLSANLTGADFTGADLQGTDLSRAILIDAIFDEKELSKALTVDIQR